MRGRLAAAAVCAVLALLGCASPAIIPPSASVAVLQGDTALDASYHVAATAYLRQYRTLDPDTKSKCKVILAALYAAVVAADDAQVLGDASTLGAKISAATTLYHQLQPMLHLP